MSMHKGLIGKADGGGSADLTLGDYITRKQRAAAFDDVAKDKYLATINHEKFREANRNMENARQCLELMGMTTMEARGWLMAWASGAGDGAE